MPVHLTVAREANQCLAQPSSEVLPPAACGNKYPDPQPDSGQKVTELGTLSPTWEASIESFPSGVWEPLRRGSKKSVRDRGDGDHPGLQTF